VRAFEKSMTTVMTQRGTRVAPFSCHQTHVVKEEVLMIVSFMSPSAVGAMLPALSAVMANPLFTPRVVAALVTECSILAVSCATLWRLSGPPRGVDFAQPPSEDSLAPRDTEFFAREVCATGMQPNLARGAEVSGRSAEADPQ
jgi:hypothetical protein